MAAVHKENKKLAEEMFYNLKKAIVANIFKYRGFGVVQNNLVRGILEPIIKAAKIAYNISDQAIDDCLKNGCDDVLIEDYQFFLLVPLFLFSDDKRLDYAGAGHFLVDNHMEEISNRKYVKNMTHAINFGTGGNLPADVFDLSLIHI